MALSIPSWRLSCARAWVLNTENRRMQRRLLLNPSAYFAAVAAKLIPRVYTGPVEIRLKHGGSFQVRDFMTINIYQEIFVDKCYDSVLPTEGRPRILDIGANVGLFALRAKQVAPLAQIACFEPFPANFNQLRENLVSSDLADVKPFMTGVGGVARQQRLYVNPTNIGGHSIFRQLSGSDFVEIELVDLDAALNRLPGGACELMKLDCEGAEAEIIRSMTPDLAARIQRIVYEASPTIYDAEDLNSTLRRLGYSVSGKGRVFYASRAKQ